MIVEKIKLVDFRNFKNCELKFDNGNQLLVGENAQGKTNLIEALYYISTVRSHRNVKDCDLIRNNSEMFVIEVNVIKNGRRSVLKIIFNNKGKQLFLNKKHILKVSEFIGNLNVVMFYPSNINIFEDAPKIRRNFIDLEISKISKSYLNLFLETQSIIKERNAYLKFEKNDEYLKVLTEKLIRNEFKIIEKRKIFIEQLEKKSQKYLNKFNNNCKFKIVYSSCININEDKSKWLIKLTEKHNNTIERDILLKQTTVGINKEDIIFTLDDVDVAKCASQGEKRSIILALKLGLIDLIYEIEKEYPILLLDDVFSELDKNRQSLFCEMISNKIQTFITANNTLDIKELLNFRISKKWNVINGTISEEN